MTEYNDLIDLVTKIIKQSNVSDMDSNAIPIGISNRHIHLSQEDLYILFGKNYQLKKLKDLSQPNQFAAQERVIICGPKSCIDQVRILGPTRSKTQVEILKSDCFQLGVEAPIRMSGDLENSAPITIVGPKGSVCKSEGCIIAMRHIHMTWEDAKRYRVKDGEIVAIEVNGLRGGTLNQVIIRADQQACLECHLDIEEANAMDINPNTYIKKMIKN